MLVGERMSRPVISVTPDMPVQDAMVKMRKDRVSRYPVIDKKGKMVGIISEDDLLNAAPSDATSLSVWEINYLLSKLTVEKVMTKDVITVDESTPLEEAARILADSRIGGLPVLRGEEVVGMITETDVFRVLLNMLGGRKAGLRVIVMVEDKPGLLSKLTHAIDQAGGNIIALSTYTGHDVEGGEVTVKVDGIDAKTLRKVLTPLVSEIKDIREIHA
jgi:acetoin utilization protein AcuB